MLVFRLTKDFTNVSRYVLTTSTSLTRLTWCGLLISIELVNANAARRIILYKPKVKNPSPSLLFSFLFLPLTGQSARKCCQSVYAILHIDNNFQLQALGGACATCVSLFYVVFLTAQLNSIELMSLFSAPLQSVYSLLSHSCCVYSLVVVIVVAAELLVD